MTTHFLHLLACLPLTSAPSAQATLTFEGFVYAADGTPAEGAMVMTSAGGRARVDAAGHYLVDVALPEDVERVQVTALRRGGRNLTATSMVAVSESSGSVLVDPLLLSSSGTCSPSWLPTFGGPSDWIGPVSAMAVYDDGRGPALYACGNFSSVGGVPANHIARWDGSNWEALGGGIDGVVYSLTAYDDGRGVALYVGGDFPSAGGVAANNIGNRHLNPAWTDPPSLRRSWRWADEQRCVGGWSSVSGMA